MSPTVKMKVREMLERDAKIIPKESRLYHVKKLIMFFNDLESHSILHKMKAVYLPYQVHPEDMKLYNLKNPS
jgi:hypothetical protein